jgi:hypothetical protein
VSAARVDSVPFQWQPDVWLLMTAIGAGYPLALRRVRPRLVAAETASPRRRRSLLWSVIAVIFFRWAAQHDGHPRRQGRAGRRRPRGVERATMTRR